MNLRRAKAFTLIELLVVIAIIGLLSSIVLSSLNAARDKARDAAVEHEVLQLRIILMQEFTDTGTFTAIKNGGAWKVKGSTCTGFTGNYATQAASVCNALVSASCSQYSGSNCVYFQSTTPANTAAFTIMAYLPGASAKAGIAQYYCVGSSGQTSIGPAIQNGGSWKGAGCYANP